MKKILYIASGRGIRQDTTGRKILSIVDCWKNLGRFLRSACGKL